MSIINKEDFITSICDALQYISYYHPLDFIQALHAAYQREQSPAAKDAMAQILINSRMCAEGHRPICQDTGIVNVFLKVGMDVYIVQKTKREMGTITKIKINKCQVDIKGRLYSVPMSMLEVA